MAFRTVVGHWKSVVIRSSRSSNSTRSPSTISEIRGYATMADHSLASGEGNEAKSKTQGEFIPVYVSVGFIALSMSFGLYTAFHQMARAPNVFLKKSRRRELIPEVVEPEQVAEHGEKFVKQSFFRKIAHIQDFDHQDVMPDPIRGDVLTRPVRVESLKDVGVEVKLPH